MGFPKGVKRDFEALERRRLEAVRLLGKGLSQAEVARRVGVQRASVNRWAKAYTEAGRAGLKKAGRAGRKPRLTDADRCRIVKALKAGAMAHGYAADLWTLPRVARLIEDECGVRYHPGHVWRVLGELGFSPQRPTGRALERDDASIEQWKRKRWPALKKTPRASGGRSS